VLIGVLSALGVAFAAIMAWRNQRLVRGTEAADRVGELRAGGVERYLRRHNLIVVAAAAVLGALVFLAYGVAHQTALVTSVAPRQFGLWLVLSYTLGVGLGVLAGWAAAWTNRRGCARVATAVHRSLDEALRGAMHCAAASGIGGATLVVLGLGGLVLVALLPLGGSLGERTQRLASVPELIMRLGGFVLGLSFVALLGRIGGGLFSKVADVGADVAGKLEASLPEDSPDNPATIADLVGDAVGDHAAGNVGALASSAVVVAGAMLVGAQLFQSNTELTSASAAVLFPLVVQAFALLAACFGIMVVRTDEREGPGSALGRGLLVSTMLHAVASAGTAKWLLGVHWAAFAQCAALGGAANLGCLLLVHYYSDSRYRPVRSVAEAARGGTTLATLRGLTCGIEAGGAVLLLLGTVLVVSYRLGRATGLHSGGLFGLAVAGLGLCGALPLLLATEGVGSMVDSVSGIVAMTVAPERTDVRARARMLDAVGNSAKALSGVLVGSAGALGSFLLVAVFQGEIWLGRGAAAQPGSIEATSPLLWVGGLGGVVLVVAFSWITLSRLISATRTFIFELRGLLGGATGRATDGGGADSDPSRRLLGAARSASGSSARSAAETAVAGSSETASGGQAALGCIETVSRLALRGVLPPALLGVGLPLFIGAALRIAARGDRVVASAEALVALLLVATIAGATGSLVFSTAGSAWDNAKKYIETGAHGGRYVLEPHGTASRARASALSPRPAVGQAGDGRIDNPTYVAAVVGDTIGDSVKGLLGPSLQALVKTLAVLALVFLPFFL